MIDTNFISEIIPNYNYGRRQGLTDHDTEEKALEVMQVFEEAYEAQTKLKSKIPEHTNGIDLMKLAELLKGVDTITFKLEGVGEESFRSKEIYEAIAPYLEVEHFATALEEPLRDLEKDLYAEFRCNDCGFEHISKNNYPANSCPSCNSTAYKVIGYIRRYSNERD